MEGTDTPDEDETDTDAAERFRQEHGLDGVSRTILGP